MTNVELKNKLQAIASETENTIEKQVAIEALSCEDIKHFFEGLLNNGCVSGWVNSLVYYADTYEFYDTHYKQIEELREDFEDSIGEPIKIEGDLKNFFAWFAFEQVAYTMANELELEI